MTVGIQQNKATLDGACSLFVTLENIAVQIDRIQAFLLATTNADLQTGAYVYSAQEVADLKSAFTDAAQLMAIYRGQQNLAVAKDFRTFSKRLIGTGL